MSAADRRLPVRFDEPLWQEVLDRLTREHRQIASAARSVVDRGGVALSDVRACAANGTDGTELAGCAKLYPPVSDGPPSLRPFGFVLRLRHDDNGFYWAFVAFGPRHPRPGVHSVYERAHRQLHGAFPRDGQQ